MIDLPYSLIIEATKEPDYFGFYSQDLEGFTGVGHSVEDCLYKAKWGMKEHVAFLKEQGLPIPPRNPDPKIRRLPEKKIPDYAGFLFGFKARQQAHSELCNCWGNAEAGQKDQQDGIFFDRNRLIIQNERKAA